MIDVIIFVSMVASASAIVETGAYIIQQQEKQDDK